MATVLGKVIEVADKAVRNRWPKTGTATKQSYEGQASEVKHWQAPGDGVTASRTAYLAVPSGASASSVGVAHGVIYYRDHAKQDLTKLLIAWEKNAKETTDKNDDAKIADLKDFINVGLKAVTTEVANALKDFEKKSAKVKESEANDSKGQTSNPAALTTARNNAAAAWKVRAQAKKKADEAVDQFIKKINACDGQNGGCFAAGTNLWTPDGYRNVEDIREGEMVFGA